MTTHNKTVRRPISRLALIARMGQEWRELRQKYPEDDPKRRGWGTLAVGIAIAALAEEEYRVDDWKELIRKRRTTRESQS